MFKAIKFILLFLLCATEAVSAIEKPAFYVWQRNWNSSTLEAVRAAGEREFFPLFAEISVPDGRMRVDRINIPPELLAKENFTPVIRVHSGLLGKLSLSTLADEIKRSGKKCVQLDIDCPESKLQAYASYIDKLKKLSPGIEFSITALPCHLKHPEFKELAGKVSYYVLQIHGLYIPENINDECVIMKRKVSLKAIAQAYELGLPFRVAIPSYSYQMVFEKESNKFKGLEQNFPVHESARYAARLTPLDFNMLNELLFAEPQLRVIWFRMPLPGEFFNLDMKTIKLLENGALPHAEAKMFFVRAGGRVDLFVESVSLISNGRIGINILWEKPTGEFELFNGANNISNDDVFGVLPQYLSAPLPGCGEKLKIASFYTDEDPLELKGALQ